MKYFQQVQFIQHVLLFLFIAFLIGCTQDPLASLPQSVKNRLNRLSDVAFHKKDLDSQIKDISNTFGRILADDFWQVSSDKEFEMVLTAKVFLDEDQFDDFNVELEDPIFENEDYSLSPIPDEAENKNEKKYLFKWNPSENFYLNHFEKCIPITFTLRTSGTLVLERPDEFTLFVTNKSQLPVLQIVDMSTEIEEGDEGIMVVHVFDPQATTTNPPVLILDKVTSDKDVSQEEKPKDLNQLLHFVNRERIDDHIWSFEYRLTSNVLDPDLDSVTYALKMFATSVSGISDTHQAALTIFNRVSIPNVIGPASLRVYPGRTYSVFIQVSDPLASGQLSSQLLTATEDLPGEVILSYDTTPSGMQISLHFSIPEDDTSQTYTASIEISNEGIENSQTVSEIVTHDISIEVISLNE